MASETRTTLKGYFNTGDTPTEDQYHNMIDSSLNIIDPTAQTISSKLFLTGELTASAGLRSLGNVVCTGDIASSGTGSFAELTITDKLTQTGPQQLSVNSQTTSIGTGTTLVIATHHAQYILVTNDITVSLPTVAVGASFIIVNDNDDGTAITVDPNAGDKFLINIAGSAGTDGKYIANSAGTSKKGDFVKLLGLSTEGWAITEKSGVWTDEA